MGGKTPAVPPTQHVELRLLDIDGSPLRGADVSLAFGTGSNDFFETQLTTDAGIVSFDVPLKRPDEGELTVTPRADKNLRVTFKVFIANYGDASTGDGMRARLNNLGYHPLSGPPDAALATPAGNDERFQSALARFRQANHLPLTPVKAFVDRLTEVHDTPTGPFTK